jgi:WD40 repeat protein
MEPSPGKDSIGSITSEEVLRRNSKKGASCRALSFSSDGSSLFAGFETGALLQLDAASGKADQRIPKAHPVPINRLLPLVNQPHLVAVGDNDGGLKLWDIRSKEVAWSYSKHSDTITGGNLALHKQASSKQKPRRTRLHCRRPHTFLFLLCQHYLSVEEGWSNHCCSYQFRTSALFYVLS